VQKPQQFFINKGAFTWGVLETRNFNNPTPSNAVAQCGGDGMRERLRAKGTLLLDILIVACLPHAGSVRIL